MPDGLVLSGRPWPRLLVHNSRSISFIPIPIPVPLLRNTRGLLAFRCLIAINAGPGFRVRAHRTRSAANFEVPISFVKETSNSPHQRMRRYRQRHFPQIAEELRVGDGTPRRIERARLPHPHRSGIAGLTAGWEKEDNERQIEFPVPALGGSFQSALGRRRMVNSISPPGSSRQLSTSLI